MDRHLVAVEVGVERLTYQRMELDRASFDEDRLERLDGQTVKGRSAVQKNGMLFDNVFKRVPYLGIDSLDLLLCIFDIYSFLSLDKTLHNERLEELERHFFRKTALIDLQTRSYDDNGTSGIVDTFSEKVLTETSLLTAEHLGKRFERTVVRSRDSFAASAVVDKGVYRFLQHTLFIPYNYFGRAKLHELFKSVVSVDNAAVKVVEVGAGESAAVELYHRTDLRRNDRDNVEDHPFGAVSGLAECLYDFESLDYFELFLTGGLIEFFL